MLTSEVHLYCPKCNKEGLVTIPVEVVESVHLSHVSAPEGFRKVQVGAFSDSVSIFCIECGVPALLKNFVPSTNTQN